MIENAHFTIKAQADGRFSMQGEHCGVDAQMLAPNFVETKIDSLAFGNPYHGETTIGNIRGSVQGDMAKASDVEIRREFFLSKDGRHAGIRMLVTNQGDKDLHLDTMSPLCCKTGDKVNISNADFDEIRVIRMARNKNDFPGNFHPSRVDEDLEDVGFSSENITAGGGVSAANAKEIGTNLDTIYSEPLSILQNDRDKSLPGLFIGVMGQREHMTRICFEATPNRDAFQRIETRCEFDEVLVEPGDTYETHWFLMFEGVDDNDLLEEYANILADIHSLPVPPPPITYYCSWYFYGATFEMKDLEEEVEEIKTQNMPIDAFVIDNGWMDAFGPYETNTKWFPRGMKAAAEVLAEAGMMPGIWTCPFIIQEEALEKYPDLAAKRKGGGDIFFGTHKGKIRVADPTAPSARQYVNDVFKKLRGWGYTCHKLDFLRAISLRPDIRFCDPKVNRAKAYRMFLEMIREALGDDAYILGCGGTYDAGNVGILNAYRTSGDVRGRWHEPDGFRRWGALMKIKQNWFRNYANRFWHTDPDATMIRLRDKPYKDYELESNECYNSEGSFTDGEAFSMLANMYVGGGAVCISERFADLQPERMAMLRSITPVLAPRARTLDFDRPLCPTLAWTTLTPKAKGLGEWWTLSVGNWEDESVTREIKMSDLPLPEDARQFVAYEFRTQTFLGVKTLADSISLDMPAHTMDVVRIAPWDGKSPILVGTSLHMSGGMEIAEWSADEAGVHGQVDTPWKCDMTLATGFAHPEKGIEVVKTTFQTADKRFAVANPVKASATA